MYLICYQIPVTKTVRQEWYFFTDYITQTRMIEKSKIVSTEKEAMEFNSSLEEWNIISITII